MNDVLPATRAALPAVLPIAALTFNWTWPFYKLDLYKTYSRHNALCFQWVNLARRLPELDGEFCSVDSM
jgi:hypothetical protein